MTNQVQDPWDSAENPVLPTFSNEIWGQVDIASWWCVLEKNVGKVAFNDQVHSPDLRRTAIDIKIIPLAEHNITFDVSRSLVAESREWASTILPSIKDLGIKPSELNGKWVKITRVGYTDYKGNPAKYTDKRTGEERESLTFKFLKIFQNEPECQADYAATNPQAGQAAPAQPTAAPANGNGGNGNKEKETAAKFLKVIVENCCKGESDLDTVRNKIAAMIPQYPLVAKYFTVDSPETMQLIGSMLVPLPF